MPFPPPIAYPLVNGMRYSFVSAEIGAAGLSMKGYKSFNYSDGLEPGIIKGTNPAPLGWTRGDYTAEASIEIYRAEFEVLKALVLGQPGVQPGTGFGEISFSLTIGYSEAFMPTVTDVLPVCRIKKADSSNSQGSDGLTIKVDLALLVPIIWGGQQMVTALTPGGF